MACSGHWSHWPDCRPGPILGCMGCTRPLGPPGLLTTTCRLDPIDVTHRAIGPPGTLRPPAQQLGCNNQQLPSGSQWGGFLIWQPWYQKDKNIQLVYIGIWSKANFLWMLLQLILLRHKYFDCKGTVNLSTRNSQCNYFSSRSLNEISFHGIDHMLVVTDKNCFQNCRWLGWSGKIQSLETLSNLVCTSKLIP